MNKAIICTIAALAFLAGCGNQNAGIPIPPKWPGAPYHLAFGAAPAKPNASGLTIPPITFKANPEMLQTRANLVIQFDTSGVKRDTPLMNQMVMAPTSISGTDGALSDDYMSAASSELAKMLGADCINGKVKLNVALTKSSIPLNATEDQVNAHRLSDWTPIELVFKNPHPKC